MDYVLPSDIEAPGQKLKEGWHKLKIHLEVFLKRAAGLYSIRPEILLRDRLIRSHKFIAHIVRQSLLVFST